MIDTTKMALEINEQIQLWRHYFHSWPELSFKENKTSLRIYEILRSMGYEDLSVGIPGFPGTGVVANLNPGKPGPVLALRAELDALAIKEMANVHYRSKVENISHACGHDAHMSMLLGTAKILRQLKDEINGSVRFIFQPGEEDVSQDGSVKTGAEIITKDTALLDGVDGILALHVWGTIPSGIFGYRSGPAMTMSALGELVITGKGGHGATPHECVDPVVAASQIILSWQTIVSRSVNPLDLAVITVGKMAAEGKWNIIPDRAELVFGVRTLSIDLMDHIGKRLREIAEGVAAAMNCTAELKFKVDCPPVSNDPGMTEGLISEIESLFGRESLAETAPMMPSDDFAWYQTKIPGVLLFLGVGDAEKETAYPQHNPRFKADSRVLYKGISLMSSYALEFINGKKR